VAYALTGTPLTNRPRDLVPAAAVVAHPLAKSFLGREELATRTETCTAGSPMAHPTCQNSTRGCRVSCCDDVLELPPKLRTRLGVDVPASTAATEIQRSRADAAAERLGERRAPGGEGSDRARLLALLSARASSWRRRRRRTPSSSWRMPSRRTKRYLSSVAADFSHSIGPIIPQPCAGRFYVEQPCITGIERVR
jgi:hypothetical protein